MEELIYKLETLVKIKAAISSNYSEISESSNYYECMEFISDIEKEVVESMKKI